MFLALLRHELEGIFIGYLFWLIVVTLTLFTALGAYTQARHCEQVIADHERRESNRGANANLQSISVSRPIPPFLALYNGPYDSFPEEVTLRSEYPYGTPSSEDFKPLNWLAPKTDLGLIVGLLMTLMAVLLAHSAITEERERGTLRLVLLSPISPRKVLTAKLLGVVTVMSCTLIYTEVIYILIVRLFAKDAASLSKSSLPGVAAFTFCAALVLAVFGSLSLAVSAFVQRSSIALAVATAIWALAVLVWPNLCPVIGSSIGPVPPRQERQRVLLNRVEPLIRDELTDEQEAADELGRSGATVELAWTRYLAIKRQWLDRRQDEISAFTGQYERQVDRQRIGTRSLLCLSPYGAFEEFSGDICGTGIDDYRRFSKAVDQYETQVYGPESLALLAQQKPWLGVGGGQVSSNLTPFHLPPLPWIKQLERSWFPIALLIFELAVLIGVCFWKLNRYEASFSRCGLDE
jgi:ABC-type transport system involved in multi-copper enzyme maturation permease subunit